MVTFGARARRMAFAIYCIRLVSNQTIAIYDATLVSVARTYSWRELGV